MGQSAFYLCNGEAQAGRSKAFEVALGEKLATKSVCDCRRFEHTAKKHAFCSVRSDVRAADCRKIALRSTDDTHRANRDAGVEEPRDEILQRRRGCRLDGAFRLPV